MYENQNHTFFISVTEITISNEAIAAAKSDSILNPYLKNIATKINPVINSIIGYCMLIFSLQNQHFLLIINKIVLEYYATI